MKTLTKPMPSDPRDAGVGTVAEHYHALAHWLRTMGNAATRLDCKSVGVTSCSCGAGVSTVAANLADAAARVSDRPVLLLDLSRTGPVLAGSALELGGALELGSGQATGEPTDCRLAEDVETSNTANLSLLRLGEQHGGAVDGRQIHDLLQELERKFGMIIVDLPPVDAGLCFAVSGLLSGVLLVVESQNTSGEAALRAKQRLIHANASVLGVILNKHSEAFN